MKITDARATAPPVKPQRIRKPPRKNAIVLAAAEKAFVKYGFGGTSVDAIAELAGVSKRTVYSNFATKQALYAQVIRKRSDEVVSHELEDDSDDADPTATLLKASVALLQKVYSPDEIALFQTVVADSRQFPEEGKILFNGPVMRSHVAFAGYFRKLVRKGVLRQMDLELAAAQFVALLKSNMHMRLMLSQPTDTTRKKLEEVSRSAIRLFLYGALKSGYSESAAAVMHRGTRSRKRS